MVNMSLSVIIPILNADDGLGRTLDAVRGSLVTEIILVDGGSTNRPALTCPIARVVPAPRGRGHQLAAGVAAANESWLLMLHADTVLQPGWERVARQHIASGNARAGYFRFALDSGRSEARRLERRVAWRCRVLALPYGDQGLLVHRDLLAAIGGVPLIPLMEDVEMVRRLGRSRIAGMDAIAMTSAGKWERDGWHYRSIRNLFCLALYFLQVPPRWILWVYR